MMKFLALVLFFVFAVNNAFGSPLIYKVKKEINTSGLVELGNFDATKYKQIRIGIKVVGRDEKPPFSKAVAEIELNAAKRELSRQQQLLEEGLVSRADYDRAADRVKVAQQIFDNADEKIYPPISIFGVENTDEILLAIFDEKNLNRSIVIDSPPPKISIKVSGKGIYSLYVWGQ
ncbi:MAG: hypothetical protein WBD27_08915 [Pyrinomonadaceae bacterium]